ncbi:MAG: hypothetical protein E7290_11345 [Lachnospiraceae bacterium]|nr:hypothetical protein [Lachnospiraceae bacterium]
MNTDRLIKNITDQIVEAQLKLGYVKETVRLYFPLNSLNVILDMETKDANQMLEALQLSEALQTSGLGAMKISARGERFEISVPADGVEYVHKNVAVSPFLVDIIALFGKHHHCTIEEICQVFAAHNANYVCDKMPEGTDFDYAIYFPDKEPDEYYYCIKSEMNHTIYHRFMKEDYLELL